MGDYGRKDDNESRESTMKRLLIAAAICLLALPAAAQQHKGGANPSAAQKGQPGSQASGEAQPASVQKLVQGLETSGFQDVSSSEASYLVHARMKDGSIAVMIVDPPAGAATTGAGAQSQASSQQALKEDLQKAGFNNVLIVNTGHPVIAKTADGSTVRMMINPPSKPGSAAGAPGRQR